MHIVSVNLGDVRPISYGAQDKMTETTGIFKLPVAAIQICRDGVAGDAVVDTRYHGGPDQAVYIYCENDYRWWAKELGHELAPGTFGENLTIAGLFSADVLIGDRLQTGAALLEVTAPRTPCRTLAARMGDPTFGKRFRAAERPGLYCRVLQEGAVTAGDPVTYQSYAGEPVSIGEMFRASYDRDPDEATIRRFLAAPIGQRARHDQEARLQKLQARRAAGS